MAATAFPAVILLLYVAGTFLLVSLEKAFRYMRVRSAQRDVSTFTGIRLDAKVWWETEGADGEQRRDVKIIITSGIIRGWRTFSPGTLSCYVCFPQNENDEVKWLWHDEGPRSHCDSADVYFTNICSAPIGLISAETTAHPCSPFQSPTKCAETFGKSSFGFMTYSYGVGYGAPSAQQLLRCDKATHGDSGVWAYMGWWKIQNGQVMRQEEGRAAIRLSHLHITLAQACVPQKTLPAHHKSWFIWIDILWWAGSTFTIKSQMNIHQCSTHCYSAAGAH